MYTLMAQRCANLFILAPTLLCSLASGLTIQHMPLPRDLVGQSIKDEYTPHDPPFNWYAMGDSYTAGPGAGDLHESNKGDCVRSVGSYGPQLKDDWLYESDKVMTFLACTSDITDQMIKNQLPEVSSDPAPDLAIFTIGGNDIGFAEIAKSCLVGQLGKPKCDDLIQTARDTFGSNDFKNKLKKIYDGIFDQMNKDFHYQILHLGYSKFFNADDDSTWCNDQTFGKVGISGLNPPKLTLELRRKMNKLSDDFNTALYTNLLDYANNKLNYPNRDAAVQNGWVTNRIFFGNIDGHNPNFEGHRFCEIGDEDPQFGEAKTWIFGVWGPQKDVAPDGGNAAGSADAEVGAEAFAHMDAASCGQDPSYAHDLAFAWDCDMAGYYTDPSTNHSVTTIPGLDFTRSFHPKTRGFTAVKDFIHHALKGIRKAPAVGTCMATVNPDVYIDSGADASAANHTGVGNPANPDTSASPTLPSGFPASLCATASGVNGFATTIGQSTTTGTAPAPGPTCTFTGDPLTGGCQCSDGTTPSRDEDNRCCLYHQPGSDPTICFNQHDSGS